MSAHTAVRVTVLDTWDEIPFDIPSSTPIADLKRAALTRSRVRAAPSEYMVKYNGAELYEPGNTVGQAGIPANGSVIVMRRRRTPVR